MKSPKPTWDLVLPPDGSVWLNDGHDVRHGAGLCIGSAGNRHASLLEAREELRAHLAAIEDRLARMTTSAGAVS